MKLFSQLSVGAMVLLSTVTLFADAQKAKALFAEGARKFEAGEYINAANLFRAADAEESNWKLQYNIGQCEAAANRHGRAMEALELYLSKGGDEVDEPRRKEIEKELDRLKWLVGFVEIKAVDGLVVYLDDEARGQTPLPGRLLTAAGVTHQLKLMSGDTVILDREITVTGQMTLAIDCNGDTCGAVTKDESLAAQETGKDAGGDGSPAKNAKTSQQRPLLKVGIIVSAVGAATVIGGVVTGAAALSLSNDLEDECTERRCLPGSHDKKDRMDALALTSNILYVAGGAIAIAGTALIIVGLKKRSSEHALSITPVFTSDTSFVMLNGRF